MMKIGNFKKLCAVGACSLFLVGCSSLTPAKVNHLNMNNEPITMEHINRGPNIPIDMTLSGNFSMDGGYWGMTLFDLPDAPVVTGMTPPGWAGVDVMGPPKGSIGSIGVPADSGYVPNMLASIIEVNDMEEAKEMGMSIIRPKEGGSWTVKEEGKDGDYHIRQYHGSWSTEGLDMVSEAIVYYVPVGDVNLVYSLVFSREQGSLFTQWDKEYPLVLQSARIRDRSDFS